jgi:hypothetical protein
VVALEAIATADARRVLDDAARTGDWQLRRSIAAVRRNGS